MKKLKTIAEEVIEEASLFEMSNIQPNRSGVGVPLFFSWGEYSGSELPHGPRFKIWFQHKAWYVNIQNPICPKPLSAKTWKKVLEFVELNKPLILDYWNAKWDDVEFQTKLQKLP